MGDGYELIWGAGYKVKLMGELENEGVTDMHAWVSTGLPA